MIRNPTGKPITGDFFTRFPKRLAFWAVVCAGCATPSFLWAMGEFNRPAMFVGVAVFVVAYALVTSADGFERFRRIRGMERSLRIGFGARFLLSTLLFPAGMALDMFPGMLSLGLTNGILSLGGMEYLVDDGDAFVVTLLATLIQGTIVNLLLAAFIALVFLVVRPMTPEPNLGLCECGYDLRASPECCPECGRPVPPEVRAHFAWADGPVTPTGAENES